MEHQLLSAKQLRQCQLRPGERPLVDVWLLVRMTESYRCNTPVCCAVESALACQPQWSPLWSVHASCLSVPQSATVAVSIVFYQPILGNVGCEFSPMYTAFTVQSLTFTAHCWHPCSCSVLRKAQQQQASKRGVAQELRAWPP
jgi:hypothetical protein